ncbi:MAG: tRNA (adenosine(37)-N6)-dimethylallyltransferase MiaA [Gammaproteobacteria bacterium]|nr:tRNA (adenosine(37)-N6)-dimethylallyltransferase MiaA [SAR86 cluster bacterium]
METLKPIISIIGPTNTGKTSLAIELSQKLDAEIISVDSVQIYKHANIGSNKLSPNNLRDYPHHLINFLEPTDSYSVGNFRNDILKIIGSLDKKNKSAILVGGSMMYFHSLFNGISELPKNDPKVRKKLDEEQKNLGLKHLFNKLQKIDKESAKNIHVNDQQRIKRSLEIYMLSGKTHTELKKNSLNPFLNRDFLNFAIVPEDKKLFKKNLKERFLKMLDEGLIEETKYLIENFSKNIKVLGSVGYKQIVDHLDGKISKEEMIEKATNANYQLSKRQITWLKKFEIKETFFANQSNMVIKILDYLE